MRMTSANKQLPIINELLFIKLQNAGPLLALIMLLVVLSILSEYFFSVNNFLNIIRQSSINLITTSGHELILSRIK